MLAHKKVRLFDPSAIEEKQKEKDMELRVDVKKATHDQRNHKTPVPREEQDQCRVQIDTIATYDNNNTNQYVTFIPSSPGSTCSKPADMNFLLERPSSCFVVTVEVVISILFCLPFGVMAAYYAMKTRSSLSAGDKFKAHIYETYVKNLFKTSCVVGTLFWFIIILVLIVQFVILKRNMEPGIIM